MKKIADGILAEQIAGLRAFYEKHIDSLIEQIASSPQDRSEIDASRIVVSYLIMQWAQREVSSGIMELYTQK